MALYAAGHWNCLGGNFALCWPTCRAIESRNLVVTRTHFGYAWPDRTCSTYLSLPVFLLQIWIVLSSNILPKLICMSGESNPGLPRGRREFYHWTTHAACKQQNDSKLEIKKSKGHSKSDSKWCSSTQNRHETAVSVFIVASYSAKLKWASE